MSACKAHIYWEEYIQALDEASLKRLDGARYRDVLNTAKLDFTSAHSATTSRTPAAMVQCRKLSFAEVQTAAL